MTSVVASSLVEDLVTANLIATDQGLVDAFGHLSARHDSNPERFLMSRYIAPGLVTRDDVVEFDLDSNPIEGSPQGHYTERFIHGEIYKARPDVNAIVHSHALALILFSIVKETLWPVFHMSSFLAQGVPVFEIRDDAGMTDLLVRTPAIGASLAKSLADKDVVLMRGHGATIVGPSIKEAVYRAVYTMINAELQERARRFDSPTYLSAEEATIADKSRSAFQRAWGFWSRRVGRA
jgi:HCOMODA/2-hydroxy-3-carboxy-muconic semialdehyde decarboxylase